MRDTLRSEVLPVRRRSPWVRVVAIAVGCGVLGGGIVLATLPAPASHVTVLVAPRPAPPPPRVVSSELKLVFHAGKHSYVKLGPAEGMLHGTPTLVTAEDGTETSIANIDLEHVPTDTRPWLGKQVVVDNDCIAKITGFRVVSRLTGEIGYSGAAEEDWTAANVMDQGTPILVGELDVCDGTYARSAELPRVVVPEIMPTDSALENKARRALLASPAAEQSKLDWTDEQEVWKSAQWDVKFLRHPVTNTTWISVHVSNEFVCGADHINLWGLFRVMPDGSLESTQLRKLDDVQEIDHIIDIEGDGSLELIGRPSLGLDIMATRASGERLEDLPLPYFGCPC